MGDLGGELIPTKSDLLFGDDYVVNHLLDSLTFDPHSNDNTTTYVVIS